jgi:Domain of unknown function (DUF4158)
VSLRKFYTLTPADRDFIAGHRTDSNWLGIAVQLWLKWEHTNLTGNYHWRRDGGLRNRKPRPLRTAFA